MKPNPINRSLNAIKIIIMFLILISLSSIYIYKFKGMASNEIFADVIISTQKPLYIGFFSQIGLFLWASSATICFYASKFFEKINNKIKLSRYLLDCGFISTIILIDDAFCLHEIVLPLKGIKEEAILSIYFLLGLLIFIKNKKQIFIKRKEIFIFCICLFSLSQLFDVLVFNPFIEYIDIEELLKLGGIISWLAYIYLISTDYLNQEILRIKKN
tara:strand:- start:547 stop:1191 length:645 start_codon:yes stop_codon:yes gene_type:complete